MFKLQNFFKFPSGFGKKTHTKTASMPSSTLTSAVATEIEARDYRQDLNPSGGVYAASFWNKTLSQFSLFKQAKTTGETRNEIGLNLRSNNVTDDDDTATQNVGGNSQTQQQHDGVLLNSYLTYVTLNLQSIMNGKISYLAYFRKLYK